MEGVQTIAPYRSPSKSGRRYGTVDASRSSTEMLAARHATPTPRDDPALPPARRDGPEHDSLNEQEWCNGDDEGMHTAPPHRRPARASTTVPRPLGGLVVPAAVRARVAPPAVAALPPVGERRWSDLMRALPVETPVERECLLVLNADVDVRDMMMIDHLTPLPPSIFLRRWKSKPSDNPLSFNSKLDNRMSSRSRRSIRSTSRLHSTHTIPNRLVLTGVHMSTGVSVGREGRRQLAFEERKEIKIRVLVPVEERINTSSTPFTNAGTDTSFSGT